MKWNEKYHRWHDISEERWATLSDSEKEFIVIDFWAEEGDQVVGDENMLDGWTQYIHDAIRQVERDEDQEIPSEIRNRVHRKVNLRHRVGKGIYAK